MQKIVDIRFIKGKRSETLEAAEHMKETLMRLAEARYIKWKEEYGTKNTIYEWSQNRSNYYGNQIGGNDDKNIAKLYYDMHSLEQIQRELKANGNDLSPRSKEVSLEYKILEMLNDGWVLKDSIIPCADNEFIQTLIKYESSDLLGLETE
jgi:hypothetical protein